jgi:hypothetical protein
VPAGVKITHPGDPEAGRKAARALTDLRRYRPILAALFGACLVVPVAEAARLLCAWPTNPALSPSVVGPGDTLHVELPSSIASVQARWSAKGTASAGIFGSCAVTTNQDSWGGWSGTMRVRASEWSVRTKLWADVTLPDDAALAGKTVPVTVRLTVRYPVAKGSSWRDSEDQVEGKAEVRVAPKWAAQTYASLGLVGGLLGLVVLTAGSGLLGVTAQNPRTLEALTFARRSAQPAEPVSPSHLRVKDAPDPQQG